MSRLRYLSVCSGIEAATVAWHSLGWEPVAFADIEKFPSAVLAHHYPNVPNLGDMTKFNTWPDYAIDLLVGGTPCQAFSVAGLRKGLADPRGNLTLTFLGIAQRYRPSWVVWENVPGVLSDRSNAFGHFLAGLAELGYGCAYRVLGAQFFGVAQRRRRVFVVGHLGAWQCAAAVLFEPESLRWDSAPSRETREGVAPPSGSGVASSGRVSYAPPVSGTLDRGTLDRGTPARSGGQAGYIDQMIPEVVGALTDGAHNGGGGSTGRTPTRAESLPRLARCLSTSNQRIDAETETLITTMKPISFSAKDSAADAAEDVAPTLRSGNHTDSHANGGVMPAVCFDPTQITSKENRSNPQPGDPAPTLAKGARAPAIAFAQNQTGEVREGDVVGTINTNSNASGRNTPMVAQAFDSFNQQAGDVSHTLRRGTGAGGDSVPMVFNWQSGGDCRGLEPQDVAGALTKEQTPASISGMAVRRLTPRECERLQGFPDDYTRIPRRTYKQRKVTKSRPADLWTENPDGSWTLHAADGPRYKALGNSMATPVMHWIGKRVAAVNEIIAQKKPAN